jgi:DNA-binding transcriptional MerR regulator
MGPSNRNISTWNDAEMQAFEAAHPEGVSVEQIVEAFSAHGDHLTEPTFRKYVQMGLLPRSVRVGQKGKHRGSKGMYPASVARQIVQLRRLMAEGFTIGEIQSQFLSVRSEIDALTRQLDRLFEVVERASADGEDEMVARSIEGARAQARELVQRIEEIERRLALRARMRRAVV